MKGFIRLTRGDGADLWIRADAITAVQERRKNDDDAVKSRVETYVETHVVTQSIDQLLLIITAAQAPEEGA